MDRDKFWKAVDEGYGPGGIIQEYVDQPGWDHGDKLAEFIASELDEDESVEEAIRKMERTTRQINDVVYGLRQLAEDEAETQRRDEKRGLYPEHEDTTN